MAERVNAGHANDAELQAYADGELVAERVTAHVASCAECREEIAGIRRVTAALSLGSKPPDSLTEKIRSRRAESARTAPVIPLRSRQRRAFLLPVGLAAAAALALFVPRAWRDQPPDDSSPPAGAKGAQPFDIVLGERIVTEMGATSIDSVSWEISGTGITAELRYLTGVAESPSAARLAERVQEQLTDAGLPRSSITVRPLATQDQMRPVPPGAVAVTLRGRIAP